MSTRPIVYARIVGALLTLYGGGVLLAHAWFVATGVNLFAPDLGAMGMGGVAIMGAFCVALSTALFRDDAHVRARLDTVLRFDKATDITMAELRVELVFPADAESERIFRAAAG